MGKLFSPDSPIIKFLTTLCELLYVNILFVLTSIPLFTIGTALSSMYSVIFKMQRHELESVWKDYFRAFKENFRQATLIWIPFAIAILILCGDIYLLILRPELMGEQFLFLKYPVIVLLFIVLAVLNYIFPQIAAFKNTTSGLLKNALLLALANFPTTISFMVVCFVIFILMQIPGKIQVLTVSILLFMGFAIIAYIFSLFYRRIFNKILTNQAPQKAEEESEEEDEEDFPSGNKV